MASQLVCSQPLWIRKVLKMSPEQAEQVESHLICLEALQCHSHLFSIMGLGTAADLRASPTVLRF